MMGYHIEASRSGFPEFKELPDRILVREDGWLGAYKFDGEPIVDYWYVPEQRVDELKQENAKLSEQNAKLREMIADVHESLCADKAGMFHKLTLASMEDDMRELGIEVPDA